MNRIDCTCSPGRRLAYSAVCCLMVGAGTALGNGIRIDNVAWRSGVASGQSEVTFDLSWSNSWRSAWTQAASTTASGQDTTVQSSDAAWVFVKVRPAGDRDGRRGYSHGILSTNLPDHNVPVGKGGEAMALSVGPADDGSTGTGVFIYRAAAGHGPNELTNVTLRLLHEASGMPDEEFDVAVHAIEMVYVDQGPFALGSANGAARVAATNVFPGYGGQEIEANAFYMADNTNKPYVVTSEAAITVSSNAAAGNLWAKGIIEECSLPAAFPKGYAAFYSMKYEVSQGQYADFLNSLSSNSAPSFFINTNYGRHTIVFSNGVYSARRPDRACGYMVWANAAAYSAWAGLRPMSEMEHAKARRGPLNAVAYEWSWGAISIWAITGSNDVRLSISPEDGTEIVTNSDVSVGPGLYGLGFQGKFIRGGDSTGDDDLVRGVGPLRVGIFATTNGTRVSSGAAYWGTMEMSGNLQEPAVTVANAAGRGFRGGHGSGTVALPPDWPQADNLGVAGVDGHFWANPPLPLSLAQRPPAWPANQWPLPWSITNKNSFYTSPWSVGMRCGRTAPAPLPTPAGTDDGSARFQGGAFDGSALGPFMAQQAAGTPAAPAGFTARAAATNRIELTWSDTATNETGYLVDRSTDGNSWLPAAQAAENATNSSSGGLAVETPYYYRVAATNSAGRSFYCYASATTLTAYAQWCLGYFTQAQLADERISGAGADPDDDLQSNMHEFLSGTVPTNDMSVLTMYEPVPDAADADRLIVSWQSATGRVYTLLAGTNLTVGLTNLASGVTATPMMNVYTDSLHGAAQKYYRVKLE